MNKYNLWVGDEKINKRLLSLQEVKKLELEFTNKGYIDVVMEVVE